ncbi:MAG: Calx-beta domain-containing protein [Gaiellaceae bacterium]
MKWAIAAVIVAAASLATLAPSAVRADAPTRVVQSVDVTFRGAKGAGGASLRPPTVSVANASATEDAGSVVFTVRLSHRTPKRVTVRYATADGTATAGSDYSAAHGRIVFNPSQRVRRISVPLIKSSAPADDETFFIVLSHPTNARIAGSQAQGKILAHNLPAAFKVHATLTGAAGSGAGTGEITMTVDAAKAEASFSLTLTDSPEAPTLGHIHSAKDANLAVNINPLPPKNGTVTGTLFLSRKLIIDFHDNPGNYYIELHMPTTRWTVEGVPSLVAG